MTNKEYWLQGAAESEQKRLEYLALASGWVIRSDVRMSMYGEVEERAIERFDMVEVVEAAR